MIKRIEYLNKIEKYINRPEIIKVITGMRRSGKSYFLRQVIDLIKSQNKKAKTIYIDKESLEFSHIKNYKDLDQHLKQFINTKNKKNKFYVFIDEIQEITEWERTVRSYYNRGDTDIYITGSNSTLLSSELSTHLTGRYIELPIYTLTFKEFLKFRKAKKHNIKDEFLLFLRYGGLPAIHLLELEDEAVYNFIRSIFNTILLKDVIKRYQVRNVALLENICNFAFDNIGSNLSAKNISDFLKSQKTTVGTDTIQNYLHYLNASYILDKAKIYDIKGKKIFEINDKYFSRDIGFKNALLGYREGDISGMLENIVYLELKQRGYQVNIGKLDNLGVDFIANKNQEKIYIQVAYLLESETTITREFKPLQNIDDNYLKLVLSMDDIFEADYKGIKRQNIRDFLINL